MALDRTHGWTITSFYLDSDTKPMAKTMKGSMSEDLRSIPPEAGMPTRAKIEGNYLGYEDERSKGVGSQAVIRKTLEHLDETTLAIRSALDRNVGTWRRHGLIWA